MKTLFIYEAIIGFIGILAVLIFGQQGLVVLALMAVQPFLGKKKFDDEDKILYKKVNTNSFILFFAFLIPMYVFFDQKINGHIIRDLWLQLVAFFFVLAHGIIGLKFFIHK